MQSFIVIHQEKNKRDEYLAMTINKNTISPFDILRITGESSLGIEEIRQMQKTVFLTPVNGNKKAIILEDAQTLTLEAQNALLKILEEPPIHALFFLSTSSIDQFLPTILSRCSLVRLQENPQEITEETIAALEKDMKLLLSASISQRLALAEKIASQKDTTSIWLKQIILYLRTKMLANLESSISLTTTLNKLQEAYRLITTTNANARVVLEHTFLTC